MLFPLPSGLLPCLSSDFGTQPPAFLFSARCLASQWLPQRLSLLPCGSRPFPLCFRFRFWLLSFKCTSHRYIRFTLSFYFSAANFYILPPSFMFVNNFFQLFSKNLKNYIFAPYQYLLSLAVPIAFTPKNPKKFDYSTPA